MTAQEYITSTIESLGRPIDPRGTSGRSLEDVVYDRVMSKKFRKLKPGQECVELTKKAIQLCVAEQRPITIFEMFGGNKLWRFEEAPGVDWAELFSMVYFAKWMRYIASVYEPGIEFVYFSQDISVERLNNVPRAETDVYSQNMRQLIAWLQPRLPANIRFTYERHYELFRDPSEYDAEIEEAKNEILAASGGKLPSLTEAMKAATELNVRLKPGQADDPEWREKVELEHQAIFKTKTLQKPMDNPYKIWTCPTYYPDSVVTGSTKKSLAKFWAGVGALERQGDGYAEVVLTPKQLEAAEFSWEQIDIAGLPGTNFHRVRVLS